MTSDPDPSSHPALREFRSVIPLSGFSGDLVALVRTATGEQFVRKAATSAAKNATLEHQARRQRRLAAVVNGCANVPAIRHTGVIDGLYYFDMAFVPSRDAVNYLSVCAFDGVAGFADRIERLLSLFATSAPVVDSPGVAVADVLRDKIEQIDRRTQGIYDTQLDQLRRALDASTGLSATASSACHGDLTFENILVDRKGELWLIDSIDSPVEHHWFDWSKLFQECEGRWHAHRGRAIATGVTWWLRNRLLKAAIALDPAYSAHHYLLLGLTFARILPYARSDGDRAFVARRVHEFGRAALGTFQ